MGSRTRLPDCRRFQTKAQSCKGTSIVGFTYDNADRRTLPTLADGVTQAYVYDKDSHVASLTYKHSTTMLGTLTYGYDPEGRRTAVGGSLAVVDIAYPTGTNIFNADNEMTQYVGFGTNGATRVPGVGVELVRGELAGEVIAKRRSVNTMTDPFWKRMCERKLHEIAP